MGWIMACHIPNLVGRHYPLGKRLPRFSCIMSSPNQIYRYMRTDRQTDRRIDRQTDRQIEVGFFREVTRSSLVLYKLYHIYFLSHHWEQFFSFDAAIFSHGLFNLSRGRPPSAWNSFCTTSWWLSSDKWHNVGWKEILPLLTTVVSQLWDLCIWRIWPHLTCLYLTLPLVSLVTRKQGHASLILTSH